MPRCTNAIGFLAHETDKRMSKGRCLAVALVAAGSSLSLVHLIPPGALPLVTAWAVELRAVWGCMLPPDDPSTRLSLARERVPSFDSHGVTSHSQFPTQPPALAIEGFEANKSPVDDKHSTASASVDHEEVPVVDSPEFRDIHPLAPPSQPSRGRRRDLWEGGSHRSSSLSVGSDAVSEAGYTTMSREFNAMVVAGSTLQNDANGGGITADADGQRELMRIGEDELEETNPLAIVPDSNPIPSPRRPPTMGESSSSAAAASSADDVPVHLVKKEEVECKISAWQTAEVAKINNRFKRQEVVINGWESEQVERASAWLKKVERKLDEQRARAMEKMQNDVAKAHQKAADKRASAEAKRGTKVAKVFELANFMRAVGRAPSKRSFF
ncbi:hypothetical protein Cni_G08414 [Canna indica]|uniref:Remorin C-terminal domain-containing protein n=1 Tax=Canna indica TaxID=4628 RepID=A0AAQ3K0Q2_9LILI|nr:hypothetical protein Cni_G08414 [Canna indica]